MKGFKATRQDLSCLDFQYEVGKKYTHVGEIQLCREGFHFCTKLEDCLIYYNPDSRFFKVEAQGVSYQIEDDSKRVAQQITLTEEIELPWGDEDFQMKAVKLNSWNYKFLKRPTAKVKLFMVKQNPTFIRRLTNPSIKLQLAAVRSDPQVIEYIKDPHKSVITLYRKKLRQKRFW